MSEQPEQALEAAWQLLAANDQLRDELLAARQLIETTRLALESSQSEARTDPLTGLRNRRAFDEELNRLVAQRQRQEMVFSLILIDVDHFKRINDTHGHLVGDAVLRRLAEVLVASLREMDFVCRYGGEEFSVICPGADLLQTTQTAERLGETIARHTEWLDGTTLRVTVSSGVAEAMSGEIAEALLARTDAALYAAKQNGRNRIVAHDGADGLVQNHAVQHDETVSP